MKQCSICKLIKEDLEFYKNKSLPDGLQKKCKVCQAEYFQNYYQNNSKVIKKRTGKRRDENRRFLRKYVAEYLQNHPCVDCGEDDIVVLEFDHTNNKLHNISQMIKDNAPLDKIRVEITKCQVRCANCHKRKTAKDFNWFKGTINTKV